MKFVPLTLALTLGLAASASAASRTATAECFEAGPVYSRGSGNDSNYEAIGMTVAAGWRRDHHKLQVQTSALAGETGATFTGSYVNPLLSTELVTESIQRRLDHVPVWLNYRYGVDFGPSDCCKIEFGPSAGVRIQRLYTKGGVHAVDTATGAVRVDESYRDSSGALTFDYGLGGSLGYAINRNWRLIASVNWMMTTHASFEQEVKPLGTTTATAYRYVYRPIEIDAHATTYGSLTLEYTF